MSIRATKASRRPVPQLGIVIKITFMLGLGNPGYKEGISLVQSKLLGFIINTHNHCYSLSLLLIAVIGVCVSMYKKRKKSKNKSSGNQLSPLLRSGLGLVLGHSEL